MKIFFLPISVVLVSAIAAIEEVIPRQIYTQKAFCSGENLRLSCSDDGVPFGEYKISIVGINIFSSQKTDKVCEPSDHSQYAQDEALCPVDYLQEVSEYSGLGLEVETLCDGLKECFIKLPTPTELSSADVCGGDSHFYALVVEFICSEPSIENEVIYKPKAPAKASVKVPIPFDYEYNNEEATTKPELDRSETTEASTEKASIDLHYFGYGSSAPAVSLSSSACLLSLTALLFY